jgi:hypothetical protein
VADRLEKIRERAKRGRYGGHTGSLTVIKFEDVDWLFREIERLREENGRLQLLLRTSEGSGKGQPINLEMDATQ